MTTPKDKEEEYYYYEEDEQDWILDSITEFLKSPVWKNPILAFIDENCLSFDEEEENKLEYTLIHNVIKRQDLITVLQKFKQLVDSKLDSFVTDLGITSDTFLVACQVASQKVHKSIINQLLAVESFLLFKKMMITRNKQLNEEAIKNMKGDKDEEEEEDDDEEDQAAKEREEAELAQAIAESQALEEKRQAQIKQQEELEELQKKEQELERLRKEKEEKKKLEEEKKQEAKPSSELPSIGGQKQGLAGGFEEINIEENEKKEKEKQERKERLKQQRDLLIQKKNEERQKEIETYHQEKQTSSGNAEEEEKTDRIKKGLAALNMGGGLSTQQIQEKRKNFMSEIRDALIAGDAEGGEQFIKKQKKKKKGTANSEDKDLL